MKISTYDLGYGDGWMRGQYVHNSFITADNLSILGRVSMDFITLESDKEEVCILNNAQDAAKQLGTISYEMTTILSVHIKRTIV
jgi:alanine racemase